MIGSEVKINGGGPEKLEGIISDVTSDHLIVIINNELIRVPLFQIKSVTVGLKSRGVKSGKAIGNATAKSGGNINNKSSRTNRSDRSNRSNRSGNHSGRSQGFSLWKDPFFT